MKPCEESSKAVWHRASPGQMVALPAVGNFDNGDHERSQPEPPGEIHAIAFTWMEKKMLYVFIETSNIGDFSSI